MKKILLLIFVFQFLFASLNAQATSTLLQFANQQKKQIIRNTAFSYSLPISAKTSAGIFDSNGVLIKHLWTAEQKNAGAYSYIWDGTDDEGRLAADGDYTAKILYHNVNAEWKGARIGNTSDNTVSGVHKGIRDIAQLVSVEDYIYYGFDYSERTNAVKRFAKNDIGKSQDVAGTNTTTILSMSTDGTIVFVAAADPNGAKLEPTANYSFVFIINAASGIKTALPTSQRIKLKYGDTYDAVAIQTKANERITSATVQPNGTYFFTSHRTSNKIRTYNKTTGALVATTNITAPGRIVAQSNTHVWVETNSTTVTKYAVNGDGTLSVTSDVLSRFTAIESLEVNKPGTLLTVSDTTKQIRVYNTSTLTLNSIFGQLNGHKASAVVSNDRFGRIKTISIDSDGSYWIYDAENVRIQHYNSSFAYLERIMLLPQIYNVYIDRNNPTRVFTDFLEFQIDYSKELDNGANGSWKLVNNWSSTLTAAELDKYVGLKTPTTLSNGRTYAILGTNEVVELQSNGVLRKTGITLSTAPIRQELMTDGSLRRFTRVSAFGQRATVSTQPLTKFDPVTGNPQWGAETTLYQSEPFTDMLGGSAVAARTRSGVETTDDKGVKYGWVYDVNRNSIGKWHLGQVRSTDGVIVAKHLPPTHEDYRGDYPVDKFDIGNGVNIPGTFFTNINDKIVVTWYNGEFWKGSQTNIGSLFHTSGLQIGIFGIAPIPSTLTAGGEGNVLKVWSYPQTADKAIVYTNNGSRFSGIHTWYLTGLSSIKVIEKPLKLNAYRAGVNIQGFDGLEFNASKARSSKTSPAIEFSAANPLISGLNISTSDSTIVGSAYVTIPQTGTYTFYVETAGQIELSVDGESLIKQTGSGSVQEFSNTKTFHKTGRVSVELKLTFPNGVSKDVRLKWSSETITKQVIPASYFISKTNELVNGDYALGIDLLRGLPSIASGNPTEMVETSVAGWSSDSAYILGNNTPLFNVSAGRNNLDKLSPDIYIRFKSNAATTKTVTRDLGNINANSIINWKCEGTLRWSRTASTRSNQSSRFQIIDNTGKIIVRFYRQNDGGILRMAANDNQTVYLESDGTININDYIPFSITASGSQITINYGGKTLTTSAYEAGANVLDPQALKFVFSSTGATSGTHEIAFKTLKFYVNQ